MNPCLQIIVHLARNVKGTKKIIMEKMTIIAMEVVRVPDLTEDIIIIPMEKVIDRVIVKGVVRVTVREVARVNVTVVVPVIVKEDVRALAKVVALVTEVVRVHVMEVVPALAEITIIWIRATKINKTTKMVDTVLTAEEKVVPNVEEIADTVITNLLHHHNHPLEIPQHSTDTHP